MSEESETYRQIFAFPFATARRGVPRKLIIDVYEDGYTPLDVMAALAWWVREDPDRLESFRNYIDGGTSTISGELAAEHVNVVIALLRTVWDAPPSMCVYVSGNKGWIN